MIISISNLHTYKCIDVKKERSQTFLLAEPALLAVSGTLMMKHLFRKSFMIILSMCLSGRSPINLQERQYSSARLCNITPLFDQQRYRLVHGTYFSVPSHPIPQQIMPIPSHLIPWDSHRNTVQ